MKVGVFIDISNLYYCVGRKLGGKVDYKKYMSFVSDLGTITTAIAYGAQIKNEACQFIEALKAAGLAHKYKKPKTFANGSRKADWDVGLTIDVVEALSGLDLVVLGSADSDMSPLADYIQRQGKKVLFLAAGIAVELRAYRHIEIPESLLEE